MYTALPSVFFEVLVHEFSALITESAKHLRSVKGLKLLT